MAYAAALSRHPLPTHAVGEVVGQVLEQLGEAPDAAVVFVTAAYAGAMEDIAATIRTTLRPGALVGASASSVLANGEEVEQEAAIALFALRGEPPIAARSVALRSERDAAAWASSVDPSLVGEASTLVLLADPFSFPVEAVVEDLVARCPGLSVLGGLASAATGPLGNRLVADDLVVDSGAVGLLLPPGVAAVAVVSQGFRPVGGPLVVTRSEGTMIDEIAGMPALDRVLRIADQASVEDRRAMARSLHLGIVLDERGAEPDRGDVLVRQVLGGDKDRRSIAVGAEVPVGTSVQFQVRDAASADEDLRLLLADARADAALVFTDVGRGRELFAEPDHDADVVAEALDGGPVAGMFCEGQVAPVHGRHALHSLSVGVLLLGGG